MTRYVAGLGCRQGCETAELAALLDRVLDEAGVPRSALVGLASLQRKCVEPALTGLARQRALPLEGFDETVLARYTERLHSPSARVLDATGCAGIAEAAALALADRWGEGPAELRVGKRSNGHASVALARVEGQAADSP